MSRGNEFEPCRPLHFVASVVLFRLPHLQPDVPLAPVEADASAAGTLLRLDETGGEVEPKEAGKGGA